MPASIPASIPAFTPTLVVRNAFGPYKRGDTITDASEAAMLLASENHANVVPVSPAATFAAPDAVSAK